MIHERIAGMAKEIPLTQGKFAIVDDDDYERVMQFKWFAQRTERGTWYAGRHLGSRTNRTRIMLHRFLMSARSGQNVDHVNLDGLDCRRSNMRFASRSQNAANRRRLSSNTSGYKGVTYCAQSHKWRADITFENRQRNLGRFSTPEEAAAAYDDTARELFGAFARLNFPNDGEIAA